MKSIFLIAAFNAFFFTIFLYQKKERSLHDNILILWLIYLGLFIGMYSFYSHELFTRFNLFSISFISLFMMHGVFLFFYVNALVSPKLILRQIDLVHLAPYFFFNLYLAIVYFVPDVSRRVSLDNLPENVHYPFLFLFFVMLTALSGPCYFFLATRQFKKHDINIFNNFSFSETITLQWLRILIYLFGIIWTMLIIITVIHHIFKLFSMVFCTDGLFLSLSAFVILIGYFGLKQKVVYSTHANNEHVIEVEPKIKYSSSRLNDSDARQYVENLNRIITVSKPFLNPNLTLQELALELGTSPHILSQIINDRFKLNFYDLINQFRVEEVKKRIVDSRFENYSILGIAFDCGFNSKSAFNRIFKKFTGQTPSQFKSEFINLKS